MALKSRIAGTAALALAVIACAGEATTSSTTATTSAPTTTTTEPTSTTVPTTTSLETTTTTTTTTSTTTTDGATTTTVELPPFPPGRTDLVHGGDTWVVVLAASEAVDAAELAEAQSAAEAAGYATGSTDCDFGAATALGLPEEERHYYTVSVYLRDEQDAHAALEAFRARDIDGAVGLVQTYCLD